MIVAMLMTWAMLAKTEPGLSVGPLSLNETFAQVQKMLGPAMVTKANCDTSASPSCFPTLTYTDGSNTVIISAESLFPWPQKVDPRSQGIEAVEIIRGRRPGATMMPPGVHPIGAWTWESARVFSPPPPAVKGWKRSKADDGEVFFNRIICGFTEGDNPPGQLELEAYGWGPAPAQPAFTLHYMGFGERC